MLVGTAELVLDEVFGIGQLARVMIQGRHLAQQAVGSDGLGPGFHHVGHHQRMMIGAGDGHHQFLHQRMLKAHELHETETRTVAKGQLQHGADGEQQDQGQEAVDAHGPQLHG